MTRDETINVIHKTIYQFFDGGDGEPMSDKDELLLEVNKAICNNIKALEQLHELGYEWGQKIEPCEDAISRQAAIDALLEWVTRQERIGRNAVLMCELKQTCADILNDLPSVTPKQRTGHWERHYIRPKVYKDLFWYCSACGDKCGYESAFMFEYCPHCGAKMESEEQE